MKLRYTKTALRQIDQMLAYLQEQSPQVAAAVLERISTRTALLADYPFAGQATSRPTQRRLVLTPYPYVIFYRVTATEVVVSRVRHAARKPMKGF